MAYRGDIGWAVDRMREGFRVRRAGWNGKGMWLQFIDKNEWGVHWRERKGDRETVFKPLPFVVIKTVDDGLVPWLCSQADLLAVDWEIAN